jgi:hypothetical protein
MKNQHIRLFEEWVNERDLSSPIFIELEASKIKVYADPESESWDTEATRADFYQAKRDELQAALKSGDDNKLRSALSDLRNAPIFAHDTSNEWRTAQIDGQEFSEESKNARNGLAYYTIRKINLFLDWIERKH